MAQYVVKPLAAPDTLHDKGSPLDIGSFFQPEDYLCAKLAQLKMHGILDDTGNPYTVESLTKAIDATGMSLFEHYQHYSLLEGTSANPYFNTVEYCNAKLNQLQHNLDPSIAQEWAGKNLDDLIQVFADLGLTAEEHYRAFGAWENDAEGNLINPSNAFDANAYIAAKLAALQEKDPATWENKTGLDVLRLLQENKTSPLSDYVACQDDAASIDFVQTVPVVDRVANDPLRVLQQANVPSNYNPHSPAPKDIQQGAKVSKPFAMGNDANPLQERIPTPVDADYVPIPNQGIPDTDEHPVSLVSIAMHPLLGDRSLAQYGIAHSSENGHILWTLDANDQISWLERAIPVDGENTITKKLADAEGSLTQTIHNDGSCVRIETRGIWHDGVRYEEIATKVHNQQTIHASRTDSAGNRVVLIANEEENQQDLTTHAIRTHSTEETVTAMEVIEMHSATLSDGSILQTSHTVFHDAHGNTLQTIDTEDTCSKACDGTTIHILKQTTTDPSGHTTHQESTSESVRMADGTLHITMTQANSPACFGKDALDPLAQSSMIDDLPLDSLSFDAKDESVQTFVPLNTGATIVYSPLLDPIHDPIHIHAKGGAVQSLVPNNTGENTPSDSLPPNPIHIHAKGGAASFLPANIGEHTPSDTPQNPIHIHAKGGAASFLPAKTGENTPVDTPPNPIHIHAKGGAASFLPANTGEHTSSDTPQNPIHIHAKGGKGGSPHTETNEQETPKPTPVEPSPKEEDPQPSIPEETQDQTPIPEKQTEDAKPTEQETHNTEDAAKPTEEEPQDKETKTPQPQEESQEKTEPDKSIQEPESKPTPQPTVPDTNKDNTPINSDTTSTESHDHSDRNSTSGGGVSSGGGSHTGGNNTGSSGSTGQNQGNHEGVAHNTDYNDLLRLAQTVRSMDFAIVENSASQSIQGIADEPLDLGASCDGCEMEIVLTGNGTESTFIARYTDAAKWRVSQGDQDILSIDADGTIELNNLHVGEYAIAVRAWTKDHAHSVLLGKQSHLAIAPAQLTVSDPIEDSAQDIVLAFTPSGNLDAEDTLLVTMYEGSKESSCTLVFDGQQWIMDPNANTSSELGELRFANDQLTLHRIDGVRDGLANTYTVTAQVGTYTHTISDAIATTVANAGIQSGVQAEEVKESMIPTIGSAAQDNQSQAVSEGTVKLSGDFVCLRINDTNATELSYADLVGLSEQPQTRALASGNSVTFTNYADNILSYRYTLSSPLYKAQEDSFALTLVRGNGSENTLRIAIPVQDDAASMGDVRLEHTSENHLLLTMDELILGADRDGSRLDVCIGEDRISYTLANNQWTPSYEPSHFTFDPEAKSLLYANTELDADTLVSVRLRIQDGDFDATTTENETSTFTKDNVCINPSDNPNDSHPEGAMRIATQTVQGSTQITGNWEGTPILGADAVGSRMTVAVEDALGQQSYTARYTAEGTWVSEEDPHSAFHITEEGNWYLTGLGVGSYGVVVSLKDNDDPASVIVGQNDTIAIAAGTVTFEQSRFSDSAKTIEAALTLSGNLTSSESVIVAVEEGEKVSDLRLVYTGSGWGLDPSYEAHDDLGELTLSNGKLVLNRGDDLGDGQENTYTFTYRVGDAYGKLADSIQTNITDGAIREHSQPTRVQEADIPGQGSNNGTSAVSSHGSVVIDGECTTLRVQCGAVTESMAFEDLNTLKDTPKTITLPSGNTLTLDQFEDSILSYTYTLLKPLHGTEAENVTITVVDVRNQEQSLALSIPVTDDTAKLGSVLAEYDTDNNLVLRLTDWTPGADSEGAKLTVTIGDESVVYTQSNGAWVEDPDSPAFHFDQNAGTITYTNTDMAANTTKNARISLVDGDHTVDSDDDGVVFSLETISLNPSPDIRIEGNTIELAENVQHNASAGGSCVLSALKGGDTVVISDTHTTLEIPVPTENGTVALATPSIVNASATAQFVLGDVTYENATLTIPYTYKQISNTGSDITDTFTVYVKNMAGAEIGQSKNITCSIKDSNPTFDNVSISYNEDNDQVILNLPSESFGSDLDIGSYVQAIVSNANEENVVSLKATKGEQTWICSINNQEMTAISNPYGTLTYDGSKLIYKANTSIADGDYSAAISLKDSDSIVDKTLDLKILRLGTRDSWSVTNEKLSYIGDKLTSNKNISIVVQENKSVSVDGGNIGSTEVKTIDLNNENIASLAAIQIEAAENAYLGASVTTPLIIEIGSEEKRPASVQVQLTENKIDYIKINDASDNRDSFSVVTGDFEVGDSLQGDFKYSDLIVENLSIAKSSATELSLKTFVKSQSADDEGFIQGKIDGIEKITLDNYATYNLTKFNLNNVSEIITNKSSVNIALNDSQIPLLKSVKKAGSTYIFHAYIYDSENLSNLSDTISFTSGNYEIQSSIYMAANSEIKVSGENTKVNLEKSKLVDVSTLTITMNEDNNDQEIVISSETYNLLSGIANDSANDTITVSGSFTNSALRGDCLDGYSGKLNFSSAENLTLYISNPYENEDDVIDISNTAFSNIKQLTLGTGKTSTLNTQVVKISANQLSTFNGKILVDNSDTVVISESIGSENNPFEVKGASINNSTNRPILALELSSDDSNYVKVADGASVHVFAGNSGDTLRGGVGVNLFTLGEGQDTFLSNVSLSSNLDVINKFSSNDKFIYDKSITNNSSTVIGSSTISTGNTFSNAIENDGSLVYIVNSQTSNSLCDNISTLTSHLYNTTISKNSIDATITSDISSIKSTLINEFLSGEIANLDTTFATNESVLLVFNNTNNTDNTSNSIICLFNNSSSSNNTVIDSEITIVGILTDSTIAAENFYTE